MPLRNGIETIEKQVVAFSRLDQSQNVFTKDLSRESASVSLVYATF